MVQHVRVTGHRSDFYIYTRGHGYILRARVRRTYVKRFDCGGGRVEKRTRERLACQGQCARFLWLITTPKKRMYFL